MATPEMIARFAARLDAAAARVEPIPMLSLEAELSPEEGYAIQAALIGLRVARGDRVVGYKAGLTSRAKMKQVGVHEPLRGVLTEQLTLEDGGAIERARYTHPRIEPEVAVLLERPLRGPVTPAQAMAAVSGICVALEVLDSRYRDFKFTLPDVVADNTSAAGFVLGADLHTTAARPEIGNLGVVIHHNGEPAHVASTAAVLGHPARALAALANMLGEAGVEMPAGSVVLTGGITAAVPVSAGDHIEVEIESLGRASLHVR